MDFERETVELQGNLCICAMARPLRVLTPFVKCLIITAVATAWWSQGNQPHSFKHEEGNAATERTQGVDTIL